MAHLVTCVYCKKVFDRDVIPYVVYSHRRYGHAECYTQYRKAGKEVKELEIIDPSEIVECCYCKEKLNRNSSDAVRVRVSLFAHKHCLEEEEARPKTDAEKLDNLICDLFKLDYVPPRIKMQISLYITKYNYTYNGIALSLYYFYNIKGNDIKKANNAIGIVPYVYLDAFNYFYDLWQSNNTNTDKNISEYIPLTIEVTIPVPVKENKMKRLFNFLDKDEIDVK